MESKEPNNISVDIPNYSGPLEILLNLAKTQKVNLAEISVTKLADLAITNPVLSVVITAPDSRLNILLLTNLLYLFILSS